MDKKVIKIFLQLMPLLILFSSISFAQINQEIYYNKWKKMPPEMKSGYVAGYFDAFFYSQTLSIDSSYLRSLYTIDVTRAEILEKIQYLLKDEEIRTLPINEVIYMAWMEVLDKKVIIFEKNVQK